MNFISTTYSHVQRGESGRILDAARDGQSSSVTLRTLTTLIALLALLCASACGESGGDGSAAATSALPNPDATGGGLGDATSDQDGVAVNFDDGASPDDTFIEPGTFGAPCKENQECDSTLCIDTADGKVCSKTCIEDCPAGFICAENKVSGGDTVFMCLPRWLRLCDPCQSNAACNEDGKSGNVCVPYGKVGSFCGSACETDKDCPGGHECATVTDSDTGHQSKQCALVSGVCACSKRAIDLGLKTTCENSFQGTSCSGERTCGPAGLSDCDAATPKLEECNGIDDDCDGKTDNFDPQQSKCKGIKNDFGVCWGNIKSCQDGKVECDAPAAQPELCNGKDDDCDGETDEGLCEDGDPCTQDLCNTDGSCKHVKLAGMKCDDGNVCTQTDKCKAGKCIGSNLLNCDDQDACSTDSCDPDTGCKHVPNSAKNCKDDGNVCTSDTCESGTCVHPPVKEGSPCPDDGEQCTLDQCKNKQCLHLPKDGKKCADDGIACTKDVCQAGKCTHQAADGLACEDGNPCTVKDKCFAGQCKSGQIKKCDDGNPCTKDACDPAKGCVSVNNDYAPCKATSKDCPSGMCISGSCLSKGDVPCAYEEKPKLCSSAVKLQGVCSPSGKCSPKSSPQQVNSPDCCEVPGICIKCKVFGALPVEVCIPF